MIAKVIKKDDEYYSIQDLTDDLKKSSKIEESGAIYTFEGFVRGKEDDLEVSKLTLTTPDKEKSEEEIKKIIEETKTKFNVFEIIVVHYIGEFQTGDSLFLVAVLGNHRHETYNAISEIVERVKSEVGFKKEEISNKGSKFIMFGG